jgi:arabinose-5-phosphate isomerase
LDGDGKLEGVITDGDLRRMLEKNGDVDLQKAKDIMSFNPKTIEAQTLAVSALNIMRQNNITQLLVTDENIYVGVLHLHDLIKEGII